MYLLLSNYIVFQYNYLLPIKTKISQGKYQLEAMTLYFSKKNTKKYVLTRI